MGKFSIAASLSRGLSTAEVARITQFIAMGGAVRALRSAESYPTWPGIKVGAEITLLPAGALSALGDQTGSAGGFLPMPRLYLAKGFFERLELIASFLPLGLNTVEGGGILVKWTFITEKEKWFSLASIVGLTGVSAFNGEFLGTNMELGILVSKDYVRAKPFAGGSFLFARGKVPLAAALGANETGTLVGTHLFIGAEFELPVNFTLQVDLFNSDPSASFFVGKKF